ncbi:membrane integrity-associated transporter subunit PqiC [Acidisoma cellulosilytica]|uniref:Membrane integrity-associated transporter subunit PqiC n=1 Tax=Acidisoma cellulosilyticum TaxID=2802395 RepID=A0A964E2Q7_9PROT|nr:PqiC family protein [Acidisoma cellulosilyticum]MCB8879661.1 membrane integrity-associated transporter subunit PqiC [Acidisoma cellulosilyticum]
MPPRRQFLSLLIAAGPVALGLSGCASADPNLYRIGAVTGGAITGAPPQIEVRTISIPGYLDRTGIVKKAQDYKIDIHSNDIWAEPLADMLQAAMVQDLTTRLTGATVIGAGGSIGANADLLVEINVLRFDPDTNGQMILQLQVGIRDGQTMTLLGTRTIQHQAPAGEPLVASIVSTMSALWGQAADDIAAFVVQSWATHPPAVSTAG